MNCINCESDQVIKKGTVMLRGVLTQRFKCKSCNINTYEPISPSSPPSSKIINHKTWVITSIINNTDTNISFLNSLTHYCNQNKAQLLIIPIRQSIFTEDDIIWDDIGQQVTENITLTNGLRLLAGIRVPPSAVNPLSGFDAMCKGTSLIVPSPQIMMKTVAINHVKEPAIIYTTGCISKPRYVNSKAGEKASFNHSYAALVVEEDDDCFHIRVLNADDNGGFYDLDTYYNNFTNISGHRIPAIVLGDEHVIHIDDSVKNATFDSNDSICSVLSPEYLIRHDVLDFHSASHHHKYDFFTQYKKYIDGTNKVEDELQLTMNYLINTTPSNSKSIIVDSNHNNHLDVWLNSIDIKREPWNAKLYHNLMYLKLDDLDNGGEKSSFELWAGDVATSKGIKFINNNESFKIHDIELGFHGHYGVNGSRGSSAQFSRLGSKTIIGHSHSPSIYEGSYCVGHSCKSKLEYNKGPSSWHHAHCIIQPNGKRQMIFIKNGKWRRVR
jgi:hypothetical protein